MKNKRKRKKRDGNARNSFLTGYKSLLPRLARYRGRYAWGLLCLVTVDAAQIAIPQFIRRAIDLVSSGVFEQRDLIVICLWMTALMALISAGRFLWRFFIHGSSRRIETELREKLFAHLQTLSWDFYQKNKIGDLMARSINDLNAVRMALGMGLVALVDFVVMATAILIIIFVQDARSALFSIIPLPLVTVLILLFGKSVGQKFQVHQEAYSKISDTAQETFAGLRVIKSFVKEWWFVKKFASDNDEYRRASMELVRLFGFFFPLVTFLSELTILVMLVIGGTRVINGLMSPGSLVAMFRYLHMLIWPLMGAGFMVNMIQRGAVSLGRVNEILNREPLIKDNAAVGNAVPVLLKDAVIEIKDLCFSYGGENEVLSNINLTVEKGEWLGVMGKTGSGKSTLIKTLARMADPGSGAVLVGGRDTRDWPLAGLRSLFAVSPQDSYLFSDSIQNNIGYGLEAPDEALQREAAGVAALERDIAGFAGGGNTLIGERGLTLSGGQKQRLAIARSLVMDSEILILDDSLSAVDAETERAILDALYARRKGRTTIIISHRVSTLRYADKVLVLDQGKTAEYGSPAELANAGGFYSRMAVLQQLDLGASHG
ncbi:MAG: ABC transporter ATP-binding protein/permease [Treponema sp.]|jgi:ATP-binding cassette subfamily B protein|nr:ABC transporter ATP-binding protein/permease [Treponema sp.]